MASTHRRATTARTRSAGGARAAARADAATGPSDGGDRRARILGAAARRFAETGFVQTTVRQIADDVNILSGSLYHHFATKEDMLHEIVRDTVAYMGANAHRIAAAGVDAERRMVALLLFDLREMTRDRTVHAILYQERKFFRRSPDFQYVVRAKKNAYDAWQRIIQDGIAQGLFNAGIDIFFTIHTIVRMLNTAAEWYNDEDGGLDPKARAQDFERVIGFHLAFTLNAIRARGRVWDMIPIAECEDLATGTPAATGGLPD